MAEYIDRERAIEQFYPVDKENDGSDGATVIYTSGKYSSEDIESILSDIPAADVAQVRHGRWECGKPCPICGEDRFKGLDADIWADWEPPNCPNCGAKMDGGNNDGRIH